VAVLVAEGVVDTLVTLQVMVVVVVDGVRPADQEKLVLHHPVIIKVVLLEVEVTLGVVVVLQEIPQLC
jgi:hypothetical protein